MISLRRALIAIGVIGASFGAAVMVLVLTSNQDVNRGLDASFGVAIGWAFIATGLFAWWRRPDNRFGALMTGVGFAWFLYGLIASDKPGVHIVGEFANPLPYILLIHLLLAFPSGRLESRIDRILVGTAYFAGVVLQIVQLLFWNPLDPDYGSGPNSPLNPLRVSHSHTGFLVVVDTQTIIGFVGLLAVVAVLCDRWRKASAGKRRALAPIYVTGALTLVLVAISLIADIIGWPDGSLEDMVDFLALLGLAATPFAFALGLLSSRLVRGEAVTELVQRIGDADRTSLRELLADALGDPSLELVYWLPDSNRYVDAAGGEVDLPASGSGRIFSEVEHGGRRVAAIVCDGALDDQRPMVAGAGAAAALALENERLNAELRARVEELRASRTRIVQAGLGERRRLERDLHDGAQQRLVALRLSLRLARDQVTRDPDRGAALIEESMGELDAALAELRELARGIHPAVLTDRGLEPALDALASRAPLPVEVTSSAEGLPPAVESAAYFVVAEALTNVAKYAGASRAEVSVARVNGHALVEVSDDGVGGADPTLGSGLAGLADRVAALDGRLDVDSPPGAGTTVRAAIPCA